MKHNVLLKVATLMLAMLVGGTGPAIAADEKMSPEMEAFQRDLKGANKAVDLAAKVGGEWRDIRWKKSKAVKVKGSKGKDGKEIKTSILGAAEEYAKMGNFKEANKLIKKAISHADMGYQQAREQKGAGPTF
jgi:hypothetical protein